MKQGEVAVKSGCPTGTAFLLLHIIPSERVRAKGRRGSPPVARFVPRPPRRVTTGLRLQDVGTHSNWRRYELEIAKDQLVVVGISLQIGA